MTADEVGVPARAGLPTRVVVAVDDAPASLRAARAAVAVVAAAHARLLVVTVVQDGAVMRALSQASTVGKGPERLRTAAEAVLRHVEGLAAAAGVRAESVELDGDPGHKIVSEVRRWAADLVVVGRCERTGPSHPALGRVAQHVIELGDVPVLVVP